MSTIFDNKEIEITEFGIKAIITTKTIIPQYQDGKIVSEAIYPYSKPNVLSPLCIKSYLPDLFPMLHHNPFRFGSICDKKTIFYHKAYEVFKFKYDGDIFAIAIVSMSDEIIMSVIDSTQPFAKPTDIKTKYHEQLAYSEIFEVDKLTGQYAPLYSPAVMNLIQSPYLMSFFSDKILRYMKDIVSERVFATENLQTFVTKSSNKVYNFKPEWADEMNALTDKFKCNSDLEYISFNDEIKEALFMVTQKFAKAQHRQNQKEMELQNEK